MSIAILNQVYQETRRLAIAGSNLAKDDFRLRKLVPALEKAGKQAPVFGKVAKSIENLIDAPEKEAPSALLDLSSLLVAILYTQGETGSKGTIKPLETVEVDVHTTQTSARMLKPLIEALTTTGSGRLNTITESFDRGAFSDLRLVNYAVAALDDKYGEIGDFVAEKILPLYGKAIIPQIKDRITIKGTGGSVRRLRLLHTLEPETARPIVLEAFEKGSKDMKIAALSCLGDSKEDMPHLLDQAKSKNKEVRQVAYSRLAKFSDKEAVDLFTTALDTKDLALVTIPISQTESTKLIGIAIQKTREWVNQLPDLKPDKKLKAGFEHIEQLLNCFSDRKEKKVVDLLAEIFKSRHEWMPDKKSVAENRASLEYCLAHIMLSTVDRKLLKLLADACDSFESEVFQIGLMASQIVCKPAEVFKRFEPFYRANVTKKDAVPFLRKEAVSRHLEGHGYYYSRHYSSYVYGYGYYGNSAVDAKLKDVKWDPKWLDAAIDEDDLDAVCALQNPKNKRVKEFVAKQFEKEIKKAQSYDLSRVLKLAIDAKHPEGTEMLIEAIQKVSKRKTGYYAYWLCPLVSQLPAKSAPKIQKLIESVPERLQDELYPHLHTLKSKKK